MILNLSEHNEYVVYQHCKMESLQDVILLNPLYGWLQLTSKMHFIAYLSIKIAKNILRFAGKNIFYEFKGMPNGYGPAMRLLLKCLRPHLPGLELEGICLLFMLMIHISKVTHSKNV